MQSYLKMSKVVRLFVFWTTFTYKTTILSTAKCLTTQNTVNNSLKSGVWFEKKKKHQRTHLCFGLSSI